MTSPVNHLLNRFIHSLRTRTSKVILTLGLCVLLIIVLLPRGISYGVRDWLQTHGADEATIGNIDFNLFTGRLTLDDLRIRVDQEHTLVLAEALIDVSWRPLFDRQFQVNEVVIENTSITLEQDTESRFLIGGISPQRSSRAAMPAEAGPAWGFGLDKLSIVNSKLRYVRPQLELNLHIDTANLTGLHSGGSTPAQFTLAGKINGSPLRIDSQLAPFAVPAGVDVDINLQGLSLAGFARLAQPRINSLVGTASMHGHIKGSYTRDKGLQMESDGELALQELDLTANNLHIQSDSLLWAGAIQADLGNGTDKPRLVLKGDAVAGKIAMRDAQAQTEADGLLDIETLKLAEVRLDNNELYIAAVEAEQLHAYLRRDNEGKLTISSYLGAPTEPPADEPARETLAVRIDDIHIGENSSLTFDDMSTRPVFRSVIYLDNVKLGTLDSRQPEQATDFTVDGKIGKFSSLNSKGTIQPFLPRFGLTMTGEVKTLELPPLTSYTSGILGYKLLSGQLQADIELDIHDNQLAGESRLVLNNLSVQALTVAEKKAIDSKADLSLEAGLAMLRDKQNNIRLKLPFKGDLSDPQFDFSDAINQAIRKAVTATSLNYLKYTLQPFGSILLVADLASRIASAVRLEPVIFTAGSTTLDATALEYQERLTRLLEQRPQLRIKICGIATSSDEKALMEKALEAYQAELNRRGSYESGTPVPVPEITDEQLLGLAAERADRIKTVLITRHGIGADRLFGCQPQIDPKKDAVPRVELGI
ncbi:DUF748 domain-containing protein [Sulfuriflexus sp.]|uniref:DUF748 domain-containing protein n=1 Tax=Sulfuriflexus sp. TaxID=2015443 RepID=UPI0028CC4CED|nr:DUF748 domain-containing protein [Sulfuriflexus sp.]MDT8404922.1 DUF748 domain-containing protein [Sulfuriflexus sp.]